jgi:predicted nucleotidyltransferase
MYLDNYSKSLPPVCQKYDVKKLWAFGSVLTDRFGPDSDVDLIVDFNDWTAKGISTTAFEFKQSLEALFNRTVDLLDEQPIRNPVLRRSIESTKQLIYGRAD